jgi:hypothetical protein
MIAKLTPQKRALLLSDCDAIEINGNGVIADVLRVLLAESERADAAVAQVAALTEHVQWLEHALDLLGTRLDHMEPSEAQLAVRQRMAEARNRSLPVAS